jgi:DNA primase
MGVVDEVKARVNVVDVIARYTPLKRAGSIYKGLCPFHSERTPSFVVFPHTGTWHCFGACGTGGDVFTFLMRKENLEFREVLESLAREVGVSLDDAAQERDRGQRQALYEANEAAAAYFQEILAHHPAAEPARAYIQRRRLDASTVEHFRLGFALDQWSGLRDHLLARGFALETLQAAGLIKRSEERDSTYDAFRNRVMIPIRDRQGRVIGFGGRVLDDSVPKYLNTAETPLFHKSHIVYGIDLAYDAIRQANQVVIVEGYMDVIAAHQHGFANVVACMGTALTAEQLRQIQRYTNNFVLALDADAAGEAATIRGLNQARQALARVARPTVLPGGRLQMTERLDAALAIISMPEGKDPDDVVRTDPELWRRLVANAQPLVDFYFGVISRKVDVTTAAGKAHAAAELAPLIAELDDEIERQHYIHQLARLVQVDEALIEGRVRAAARTPAPEPRGEPGERRIQRPADRTRALPPEPPPDEQFGYDPGADSLPPEERPAAEAMPARRPAHVIDAEDHLLAMLLREPDTLVWLSQWAEELRIDPLRADDLEQGENQEIFRALKRFITSDEPWDFETFQETLANPLHPKLATLLAYSAQLPPRTDPELREGMIKDIVHLRLQRLKSESVAIKFLVDEAQRSGERDAARTLGSVYGRIQRELDHLQPLKLRENHLDGDRRRRAASGVSLR